MALSFVVLLSAFGSPGPFGAEALPSDRQESPVRQRVRVTIAPGQQALDGRFDVAGRHPAAGWIELIVTPMELDQLTREGYPLEILTSPLPPKPLLDPADATRAAANAMYTDRAEVEALLAQTAADHPSITRLETIGTSVEGRPILALKISDQAAIDEDEPTLLFSAAHHPREVMTVEVVLDLIEQLTDLYGVDPQITDQIDRNQIWCVPVVNPDGLEIVFTEDDLWRKNARDNDGNGRTTWKDGVDVNRNYRWGWGGQCLGSTDNSRAATYRGPFTGSEPETVAMVELGRRIRPVIDVEFHSYGQDVFYSMGCDPALFSPRLSTISGSDQNVARVVVEDYAALLVRADGVVGFTPAPFGSRVDGIGRDHQAFEHGTIAMVTEINSYGEGGFQPPFDLREATVSGQRPGWRWLIDRVHGPAIGGLVVDAVSGQPLAAELALDEMTLPDGRFLTSDPVHGRFHMIVVPGSYTLRVRAEGYQEAVLFQTVGGSWQPLTVPLQPVGSLELARFDFEPASEPSGWQVGQAADSADGGLWVLGEPFGTWVGDAVTGDLALIAPAFDRSPAPGRQAYVTGNSPLALAGDDDVDSGTTSLVSPAIDLAGRYAVELSWKHWVHTDPADPFDGLSLELSGDGGQSWLAAGHWLGAGAQPTGPGWESIRVRLDDWLLPGPDTRLRFVAGDTGADHEVEVALDELRLAGWSLAGDGTIATLGFPTASVDRLEWQPVPGAPDALYEVIRGDLSGIGFNGGTVDLGPLTCIPAPASGGPATSADDPELPPAGSTWFYLVRFKLGFSEGDWGVASAGEPRTVGTGCLP